MGSSTPSPSKTLVKLESSKNSPSPNMYTTIDPIRPNYQSALVTSYDPYAMIPSQPFNSVIQTVSQKQPQLPYHQISSYTLFYIEPVHEKIKDPAQLAKAFFPVNFNYVPGHPSKTLRFYTDILTKTESVQISPIYGQDNKILYHKLIILKILNLHEWDTSPYKYKTIKELPFNYYDYIDAWEKVFLHQNESMSHSWFINWDNKFRRNFPSWFYQWWSDHGPEHPHFPEKLQEIYKYFLGKYQPSQKEQKFMGTLVFMSKYKIPWIFKWSYASEDDLVWRINSVKWWNKFNIDRIISQVSTEFPTEPVKKINQSPSSSQSKTKKELLQMAEQLLQQASQLKESDEESEASSPQPDTKKKEKMRWADYEESQDPYDFSPVNLDDD